MSKVIKKLEETIRYTEEHDIPIYVPPKINEIVDKINEIIKYLNANRNKT